MLQLLNLEGGIEDHQQAAVVGAGDLEISISWRGKQRARARVSDELVGTGNPEEL